MVKTDKTWKSGIEYVEQCSFVQLLQVFSGQFGCCGVRHTLNYSIILSICLSYVEAR